MSNLMERLYEAPARVEHIVHLPTMAHENFDLYEWLVELPTDVIKEVFGSVPEGREDWGRAEVFDFMEESVPWLTGPTWIVEVSTPVKTAGPTDHGYSFSWGNYLSKCHCGATFEEALEKGLAWAESVPVRQKQPKQ